MTRPRILGLRIVLELLNPRLTQKASSKRWAVLGSFVALFGRITRTDAADPSYRATLSITASPLHS